MMPLEHRLHQDRAKRDAALAVFKSDLGLIRADLNERGIGGRLADRIGDSAMDIVDDAVDFAEENKGTVAAAAAALVLWFARRPIVHLIAGLFDEEEPEPPADRSLLDRLRSARESNDGRS
jgi:hypothetical protein